MKKLTFLSYNSNKPVGSLDVPLYLFCAYSTSNGWYNFHLSIIYHGTCHDTDFHRSSSVIIATVMHWIPMQYWLALEVQADFHRSSSVISHGTRFQCCSTQHGVFFSFMNSNGRLTGTGSARSNTGYAYCLDDLMLLAFQHTHLVPHQGK